MVSNISNDGNVLGPEDKHVDSTALKRFVQNPVERTLENISDRARPASQQKLSTTFSLSRELEKEKVGKPDEALLAQLSLRLLQ